MSNTCLDKLVVSTSCSLMHTAVDLVNETKLDDEIKSWLAFAAQKVVEVNALAKALAGQKDEVRMASIFIFSLLSSLS
jgi:5-methyltetrahydropteroyltriglutamate--homocysteine methyltransferase